MHTKEELEQAIQQSENYSDVCRYFGLVPKGDNFLDIKSEIKNYGLDISHFKKEPWNKGIHYISQGIKSLDEVLVKDCKYNTNRLRLRLINNGLKEHKCECCGNTEWNGKPIPLELHHINGDHYDNRLENLQLLCPNCHAQTDTYRGSNQERYKIDNKTSIILSNEEYVEHRKNKKNIIKEKTNVIIKQKENKICPVCGKSFIPKNINQKYCSQECSHKDTSKKPSLEELQQDIKNIGLNQTKIAQKYNVTANAVKKWLIFYKLYNAKYVYHNTIKKKIEQYDLNNNYIKTFDSISEARRETKASGITQVCMGLKKSSGGFIWKYVNDEE